MPSRKVIFVGLMFVFLALKIWWLFLPMLGFAAGHTVRGEKERRKKSK